MNNCRLLKVFKSRENLTELLFFSVLTILILLGFKYIIFYQSQLPVFLYTKTYLVQFFTFPGGGAEYLAAFFRQFYNILVLGFALNWIFIFLSAYLTKKLLKTIGVKTGILHLLPAILLFAVLNKYDHNLAFIIAFVLVLVAIYGYVFLAQKNGFARVLFCVMSSALIYFLVGGMVVFYVLVCILYELLFSKAKGRLFVVATLVIMAVVLPFLSARYFFAVSIEDAYFYLLPLNTNLISILLLLIFPLVLLFVFGLKKFWYTFFENNFVQPNRLNWLINGSFIMTGLLLTSYFSVNKVDNTRLKVQYYADNKMWKDVLETVDKFPLVDKMISFQTNRALFYTGQLGEKLFDYPQVYGFDGLFVDRKDDNRMLELCSEQYFDLGFINESKHWSYEAFVFYGNKPRLLKRLALIYIINENYAAALKYLNPLSKTLFYRKWANNYKQKCLNPKLLVNDKLIQDKRKVAPQFDFFADRNNPDMIMNFLLKQNPKNKMAFEYLMVYYLFSNKFMTFKDNLYRFRDFDYDKIPRNFQEGIAVVIDIVGDKNVNLYNYRFDNNVMIDFRSYISTMRKNKGNIDKAQKAVQWKYWNTYWYFIDFTSPVTKQIRMQQQKK